jgi:hypothetical protein
VTEPDADGPTGALPGLEDPEGKSTLPAPAKADPVDRTPRDRTIRFAWWAVAVIIVAVIALVTYALSDTPVTLQTVHRTTVAGDVVAQVSNVPPAVFDAVGTDAPDTTLVAPTVLTGQPALETGGKPEVLFVGAEYCPFCAAERWPLIVALSRFGHFTQLKNMQSAPLSVFPGTQTFSFVGATYSSRYVAFSGVELYSDAVNAEGAFARIATLTPVETIAVARYGVRPGPTASPGTFPFVDIGNRMVTSTSGFSPAVLVKQSQAAIAGGLSQAGDPITRAVVASANELTAGICAVTGHQPGSVCTSKGVRDTEASLGLS